MHKRKCIECGYTLWSPLNLTITIKCGNGLNHGAMKQAPQNTPEWTDWETDGNYESHTKGGRKIR